MHRGQLQQWYKMLIRQVAEEVNALPIGIGYLWTHFTGKDIFPFALFWSCTITDIITTHNQDSGIGSTFKQIGQSTHKNMVTTIGFEVAVDKSNHFIGFR